MDIYQQLERDEGNKSSVYLDSEGFQTIGIGFMIDSRKGGQLFPEEISFILNNRVAKLRERLLGVFPWMQSLDAIRFAAVTNLAYNIGISGLSKFVHFLAKLQTGDYAGAADELLNSEWATQVGDRSRRLAEQVKEGIWV